MPVKAGYYVMATKQSQRGVLSRSCQVVNIHANNTTMEMT